LSYSKLKLKQCQKSQVLSVYNVSPSGMRDLVTRGFTHVGS
jgi:hypothetical protein